MDTKVELPTACAGFRHTCSSEDAAKMAAWVEGRGGIAVWLSVNFANPAASWSTPATIRRGDCCEPLKPGESEDTILPYPKPTWQAGEKPVIIMDPAEVGVAQDVEVKRFHVGTCPSQGLSIKVTDAGSARIRREVEKAGEGAYYRFEYDEYKNAVIMRPKGWVSLKKWMEKRVHTQPS